MSKQWPELGRHSFEALALEQPHRPYAPAWGQSIKFQIKKRVKAITHSPAGGSPRLRPCKETYESRLRVRCAMKLGRLFAPHQAAVNLLTGIAGEGINSADLNAGFPPAGGGKHVEDRR